jgi:hypothetical protein
MYYTIQLIIEFTEENITCGFPQVTEKDTQEPKSLLSQVCY